ncbi:MAG: peptidoglycan-binding protein LysM [Myxococcota bacterium]|nr:peptidoglycan-binding protein LysM [Myxococcota bacterium]
MGLFDFVKEAGERILSGSNAAADSEAVNKRVSDLGISLEGLKVEVDGDKAVVSGKAANQADREKVILAAGNNEGIAQVEDHIEVAEAAPESQYYRVVSGDSLSKIAKEFYGDPMKYPVIFEANQPMLKDPNEIYPGQVLRIPPQA